MPQTRPNAMLPAICTREVLRVPRTMSDAMPYPTIEAISMRYRRVARICVCVDPGDSGAGVCPHCPISSRVAGMVEGGDTLYATGRASCIRTHGLGVSGHCG